MKKTGLFLLLAVSLFACKKKSSIPDVSGIKVEIPLERFDIAFFKIDTTNVAQGLRQLKQRHPDFYTDFMEQILGVNESEIDPQTLLATKQFLSSYKPIFDSIQPLYQNAVGLRKKLEEGFRFVKYYFPNYKTGKAILFLGPFDAPGVATTQNGLAIGLQQFAGSNFSVYQYGAVQEMFPSYISRRFAPEYIPANSMKAVVEELFPDRSGGKPLIEQMVEKGKQWYLLDKFLPTTHDSLKTGFTKKQIDWCTENEGLIWSHLIKNEDLQSLAPTVIQTYIGEAPFTQVFSQEFSPGNIGQWIGWQIVKKYANKNEALKPEDIMRATASTIIEEAKYKPK
jgi:hypothetical protein